MTNWGDIATHHMGSKQENHVREARFLANADGYMTEKPVRSLADIARTIRHTVISARAVSIAEPNLSLEPSQKPC